MMLSALLVAMAATLPGDLEGPQPVDSTGTPVEAKSVLPGRAMVFKAAKIYVGDGTVIENGSIVVQDGVITQVGAKVDAPKGAAVVEHDGAISPGLIALHSNEGAGGELLDSTREVMPEAEARYAFAPQHSDYRRARQAGITSLVLAPSSASLIGGQSAVVKTAGGKVVKPSAHLAVSVSSDALNFNSFPTSYAGAMKELNARFSEPEGAVARAVSGALPVLVDVNDRAEIGRALGFVKTFQLKGALYGSFWAEDLVEPIKESGMDVIATPFDVGDGERQMRSIVALQKAGVRIGFGLDAPARHPHSLRLGAAMCVRAGMPADAARKALTGDAAIIAGIPGRIGRLARGLDADIVLWSGDPTALSSTVEGVYIDGKHVFGGEK